jgi:hypothetical protein
MKLREEVLMGVAITTMAVGAALLGVGLTELIQTAHADEKPKITDIAQYEAITELTNGPMHIFVIRGSFECGPDLHRVVMVRTGEDLYIANGCGKIDEANHVMHLIMEFSDKVIDINLKDKSVEPLTPDRSATHPGVVHAG